jgi:hypothetical protein
MIRTYVVCEGQTEQFFVSSVLRHHRNDLIHWIPILPGKSFNRPQGGDIRWDRIEPDLQRTIKSDPHGIVTTMFDFYALDPDFPNRREARGNTPSEKATHVQNGMLEALSQELDFYRIQRFIPYIQMHEFEALMLSHPSVLADTLYSPHLTREFQTILDSTMGDPEAINDSPNTAPSKRIKGLFPEYDKVLYGSLVAEVIGLERIRGSCLHFNNWLVQIEMKAEMLANALGA